MQGRATRILEPILAASVFGIFLRAFLLAAVVIESRSMSPTLEPGDRVLVNRFIFSAPTTAWLPSRAPGFGDLVELRPSGRDGPTLIKRVAGRGPVAVRIRDKKLSLDGVARDVSTAHWDDERIYPNSPFLEHALRWRDNLPPLDVAAHSLFVLGDNRDFSVDSRMFGPVDARRVIGRPFLRVGPSADGRPLALVR